MPWTASDADRFKKGLSKSQKEKWASIANGALSSCLKKGGIEKECAGKAVKIANSKFQEDFGNVPPPIYRVLQKTYRATRSKDKAWEKVYALGWRQNEEGNWVRKHNSSSPFNQIFAGLEIPETLTPDMKERLNKAVDLCVAAGGDRGKCLASALEKLHTTGFKEKKFQYNKNTPPDPRDGHTHSAAFDENGDGATSQDGEPLHNHVVRNFRVDSFYGYYDPDGDEEGGQDNDGDGDGYYVSVHPGSLAFAEGMKSSMTPAQQEGFKKCMDNGGNEKDCIDHLIDGKTMSDHREVSDDGLGEVEMEIFRPGTHNGDEFSESDLEDIAANYHKLKDELRPKLKITHRDHQETVAGLASYGDIVDVFLKRGKDGLRRLYARINNIPKEVIDFMKKRRFPERSIELYPEFKLGTIENSPIYKNVLKAIALLGSEMPAVSGMEPIKLEECLECQGTICFRENIFSTQDFSGETQKKLELTAKMTNMAVTLE